MSIIKLINGFLLKYPNANVKRLPIHPFQFYEMKKLILNKYGLMIGYDKQYIEKICYTCNGLGEVKYVPCPRCEDGIFERVWVKLHIVKLGRDEFHLYGKRFKQYEPQFKYRNIINGCIEHKKRNTLVTILSLYILLYFFDKKLLKQLISNRFKRSFLYRKLSLLKCRVIKDDFIDQDLPF